MDASQGQVPLTDQERLDQQAPASNGQSAYNTDGSSKAKNFHLAGLPHSKWPPSLTADGHFSVHRDALAQVAGHMAADLTALRSTLSTLNGGGAGGSTLGGWETADGMGNNAGQAYYGISTFYERLNEAYDEVVGYLRQTVTNYADAETSTATAANNVGTA